MTDDTIKALLWDMDGVLADVSQSYRAAIIGTAKHFGVLTSNDEIEKLKLLGDANNDWHLTYRLIHNAASLIQEKSCSLPSLDEVTSKFEDLYQGTSEKSGLFNLESLLVAKGLLAELSDRLPSGMAVVTGRPRKDCMTFLRSHEYVLVTM